MFGGSHLFACMPPTETRPDPGVPGGSSRIPRGLQLGFPKASSFTLRLRGLKFQVESLSGWGHEVVAPALSFWNPSASPNRSKGWAYAGKFRSPV